MRKGVLLSDAPDRFFDPCVWGKIKAYAGQRYNALAIPVPVRHGDDFWGPVESDEQFRLRSQMAQRARELTFQFRSGLCDGTYVAAGFCAHSANRVLVDRDLCRELWPMFATDALRGINRGIYIEFMQVRVVEIGKHDNPTQQLLENLEE
jgi:hypothetical protein